MTRTLITHYSYEIADDGQSSTVLLKFMVEKTELNYRVDHGVLYPAAESKPKVVSREQLHVTCSDPLFARRMCANLATRFILGQPLDDIVRSMPALQHELFDPEVDDPVDLIQRYI